MEQILAEWWILVATDYVGLGTPGPHPYLIGEGQGRSVLDAVRAARQMSELDLGDRTVVWGHSQGGHTALWTGILAPTYAPEVNVVGVASLAPASDLVRWIDGMSPEPITHLLLAFVVSAYSEAYPEVGFNAYIRPEAREIARSLAGRCFSDPAALVSVVETLPLEGPIYSTDPTSGPLGTRLVENVPDDPIEAPLLIAQGESDVLILPAMQAQYVADRCEAGQRLEYRTCEGRDHLSLVASDSPLIPTLIRWTQDRFDGEDQADGCQILAG